MDVTVWLPAAQSSGQLQLHDESMEKGREMLKTKIRKSSRAYNR